MVPASIAVSTGPSIDALVEWAGAAGRAAGPFSGVDVLATGVGPAGQTGGAGPVANRGSRVAAQAYGVDLAAVLDGEGVRGRAGEVVRVPVLPPRDLPDQPDRTGQPDQAGLPGRWLLVGTGSGTPQDLRRAGAALARAARGRTALAVDLLPDPPGGHARGVEAVEVLRAMVEGLLLVAHRPAYRPVSRSARAGRASEPERVVVLGGLPRAVALGDLHARTGSWSRDLAITPASVKSPGWMVDQARTVAERSGLAIEVWDADRLAAEGFGGLLAVGGGSATPPYLVRLDHRPPGSPGRQARSRRPVVLIGKGITFDTGGLSLKPREAMVAMKTDMTGAGSVLAAVAACAEAAVRRPVTALLPLAENAIGASSYRPGDVVRHYGGRTVEVANTDAEGRMVLADALAYADHRLDPDVVVDVATLTGAATQGLGRRHAALYTADDALARALTRAGQASGELCWRMPLVEDYTPALRSQIADLRHVPAAPSVGGGSITAALFLREFVGSRRWAHLDIAGPARSDAVEHHVPKGPTGFGARLVLRWLERL